MLEPEGQEPGPSEPPGVPRKRLSFNPELPPPSMAPFRYLWKWRTWVVLRIQLITISRALGSKHWTWKNKIVQHRGLLLLKTQSFPSYTFL